MTIYGVQAFFIAMKLLEDNHRCKFWSLEHFPPIKNSEQLEKYYLIKQIYFSPPFQV